MQSWSRSQRKERGLEFGPQNPIKIASYIEGGVFEGKHMCVLCERVHVYVYYVRSVASKAQISLTLQSPLILKQILQDAAPHRDESGVH